MSTLNQPDAIDLIDGLENENRKLRALNAELRDALKNFSNCAMPNDPWSPEFLDGVHNLIAKAEGKCAN
jgi:hypothetical protein